MADQYDVQLCFIIENGRKEGIRKELWKICGKKEKKRNIALTIVYFNYLRSGVHTHAYFHKMIGGVFLEELKCPICGKTFSAKEELMKHKEEMHPM